MLALLFCMADAVAYMWRTGRRGGGDEGEAVADEMVAAATSAVSAKVWRVT